MPELDNLDKIAALANRTSYVERVKAAIVQAAVAVGNGADPDPSRDGLRRSLAQRVLVDPEKHAPIFAWATATNLAVNPDPAVDKDWPSGQHIEFAVTTVWDAIAGAAPPPQA
jgi:hypothetical protein